MKQKIGFCGLGKMGSVMAPLFIEAGYSLTVYNRSSEKTDPLKRIGASIAELPSEVSEESEIIFTMLSDDEAIESIYLSKDGLLSADINGRLFIDMSTIKPKTVLKISNEVPVDVRA